MTEIFADTLVWHGDGKTVADPFTWHDVGDLIDKTQVPCVRPGAAWEGVTSTGFSRISVPVEIASASVGDDTVWYFKDHTLERYDYFTPGSVRPLSEDERRAAFPSWLDRLKHWIGR